MVLLDRSQLLESIERLSLSPWCKNGSKEKQKARLEALEVVRQYVIMCADNADSKELSELGKRPEYTHHSRVVLDSGHARCSTCGTRVLIAQSDNRCSGCDAVIQWFQPKH